MATGNDTKAIDDCVKTQPLTFDTWRDTLCFALDVEAVLKAVESECNSNEFEGVLGLFGRVRTEIGDEKWASDEVRAGQLENELRCIQSMLCGINERLEGTTLLYTADTLIDLTIARMRAQLHESRTLEVQHG